MGRYIPPAALDAGLTTANQAAGKPHALGNRARKIGQGILTVRFEMPFAIWCSSCPKPTIIAQGVRFNAEKKRVGNYYSTPILSFRMKHGACGGTIEIRTDPKNAEYVVHEGAKRRDYGADGELDADGKRVGALGEILTEEEKERRRNDAFAAFEGKKDETQKGKEEGKRVEELYTDRERDWKDPYAVNQRLRRGFRAERKVRHRHQREKEAIQDRLGLGIELLDETEADRQAASLVEFGDDDDARAGDTTEIARKVAARPLFGNSHAHHPLKGSVHTGALPKSGSNRMNTKVAISSANSKLLLQKELESNTRAAMDPFNPNNTTTAPSTRAVQLLGFKRKRPTPGEIDDTAESSTGTSASGKISPGLDFAKTSNLLVDYDSD